MISPMMIQGGPPERRQMPEHSQNSMKRLWKALTARRPMEHETSLFLLVSFLDYLMTYWMLHHRGEQGLRFAESNAVANWFLAGWGIRGLLYFKVAMSLLVVLLSQVIHTRRPIVARWILGLGTAVTGATVVYSVALYLQHR
jgi:hypothetical protein